MQQAQIVIYEGDTRVADLLRETCQQHAWRLRELRRVGSVLNVLREGANVLVLRVGRDLYEEMALLEQVSWSYPETAAVVVGDVDHPDLAALAWDLGAAFVLLPPFPREYLPLIVAGLMERE